MDYNIYIHDKTNGQKPTQPRKGGGANTTPKQLSSAKSNASSGFSLKSLKSGFKKLPAMGKLGIALYAIKKAADIGMKVVDTIEPFVSRETGDYRFKVGYGNFKIILNHLSNPLSAVLSDITTRQQNMLFNKKQEQERLLLGDSFINSNNRKV